MSDRVQGVNNNDTTKLYQTVSTIWKTATTYFGFSKKLNFRSVRAGTKYGIENEFRFDTQKAKVEHSLTARGESCLMKQESSRKTDRNATQTTHSNLAPASFTVDIEGTLQGLIEAHADAPDDDLPIEVQDLAMKTFRSALSEHLQKDLEQALWGTDYSKDAVLDMIVASVIDERKLSFKTPIGIATFVAGMQRLLELAKKAMENFLGSATRHRFILTYYGEQEKQGIRRTTEQQGDARRCYEKIIEKAAANFGIAKDDFITALNTEINRRTEHASRNEENSSKEVSPSLYSLAQVTQSKSLKNCADKALESILEKIKENLKKDESYLDSILSSTAEIDENFVLSRYSKKLLFSAMEAEIRQFLSDEDEADDFVWSLREDCDDITTMDSLRNTAGSIYLNLLEDYELTEENRRAISERHGKISAYSNCKQTLPTLLEGFVGAKKIGVSNWNRLKADKSKSMKDRAETLLKSAQDIDSAMKRKILKCALEVFSESVGRSQRRKSESTTPNLYDLSNLSDDDLIRFKDLCKSTDFMRRVVNAVYSQETHIEERSVWRGKSVRIRS